MSTEASRMERAWRPPPGFGGWLAAVNHRSIGKRYMATAFVFFLVAGVEAVLMRVQLAAPGLEVLGPETYNQFFTMHGSTMMFLFVVPFLEGLAIYVVPLMIGARDMSFPRLNAFGYWIFLFAGVMLHLSFFTGTAPNSGWFNYVPLTGPGYSPGVNIDYWVSMITFLEVAALVAAVELIVTIFRMRAPGMTLSRMPLFVWSVLVMAFMIVFAMPPLVVASLLLGLDRLAGTHFYNVAAGGDPLLWQHLFWFFGHPDVYIMLLPALGIVSTIVPVFARRPLPAYSVQVLAYISIGFLSFGLWVHHMYATGLPSVGMSFFTAASMMITIPTSIQIFSWMVTLWRGKPELRTPLLFVIGFIVLFILGGITGVMIASVPFDRQVHDTFFIVAHFHYVLVGGVVFPIFASLYYWFPKISGRRLSERLGRWHFWLFFSGFNLTFLPMHVLGFQGMPRRVYTYLEELGWGPLNLLGTIGAFVMTLGTLVLVVNLAQAWTGQADAHANEWGADTLEWATSSPPPQFNFLHVPVVVGRHPLWASAADHPTEGHAGVAAIWRDALKKVRKGRREAVVTTALDAELDYVTRLPRPSVWPLWAALSLTVAFLGAIVHPLVFLTGLLLTGGSLAAWHWPRAGATGP